jgi:hypothetical protein
MELYIYEVESRPMVGSPATKGMWLTHRVVANGAHGVEAAVVEQAVAYWKCGVELTLLPRKTKVDALSING